MSNLPKWKQQPEPVANHSCVFGVTMKDHVAWPTRISSLIFFCVLVGSGALLALATTLNATQFFLSSQFLSTSFTGLEVIPSDHLLLNSNTTEAELEPSPDAELEPSPDAELESSADAELESSEDAELEDVDHSDVERAALPLSFTADVVLQPHPVDLSTLSDVYHSLSDATLLGRASAVPRQASLSPKLAYLFLTRGPLPFGPLWERYFKGHTALYSIYIHAHPNYRPSFPSDSVFYRRNVPSKEVFWGKLSVFAAERRLLANALLDPANERFILLSESCIPIRPLPVAYHYFTESRHSFVDAFFLLGRGGMGRYTRIKDKRKMKPEIMPEQWRKGSQWFEMERALAHLVVADRKYYPKYEHFLCKGDSRCYIDEHYLATVLTILAPEQLANRTSTFIDFSRRTAHPKQWDEDSVRDEKVLDMITSGHNCTYNGQLTQMCHMFARKFSPSALEPLLELAATALGIP